MPALFPRAYYPPTGRYKNDFSNGSGSRRLVCAPQNCPLASLCTPKPTNIPNPSDPHKSQNIAAHHHLRVFQHVSERSKGNVHYCTGEESQQDVTCMHTVLKVFEGQREGALGDPLALTLGLWHFAISMQFQAALPFAACNTSENVLPSTSYWDAVHVNGLASAPWQAPVTLNTITSSLHVQRCYINVPTFATACPRHGRAPFLLLGRSSN